MYKISSYIVLVYNEAVQYTSCGKYKKKIIFLCVFLNYLLMLGKGNL